MKLLTKFLIALFLGLSIISGSIAVHAQTTGPITNDYFGLDINKVTSPWPNTLGVRPGIWRSLGASVDWAQLEPQRNVFNWSLFDRYAQNATSHGQEILYTVFETPAWASSSANGVCGAHPGTCFPPSDMTAGDTALVEFVTALYNHTRSMGFHIKYWECWNEPNNRQEWAGSTQELVSLCSDLHRTVHSLDAGPVYVTTPPFMAWLFGPTSNSDGLRQFTTYLDAGGGTPADILAHHMYCFADQEEAIAQGAPDCYVAHVIDEMHSIAETHGLSNLPIWSTEGNDLEIEQSGLDPDLGASLMARYLLQTLGRGDAEVTWFGWDYGNGDIGLISSPGNPASTLNKNGVAYKELMSWIVGKTVASPCTGPGVYTCVLRNEAGDDEKIMWDDSQTCGSGRCTTKGQIVDNAFTHWTALDGTENVIINHRVPVGIKPVLIH